VDQQPDPDSVCESRGNAYAMQTELVVEEPQIVDYAERSLSCRTNTASLTDQGDQYFDKFRGGF
jgi:hypothetical protein